MADFTLRLRRYDPESGEAPYWDGAHDRPRAAPLGARGHPPGQGALRRLDRHPLLVPRRDLRLVRRADQRPARPRLPHAPRHRQGGLARRRHRGRAHGQHARDQGPHRRHGRGPLEEDPARHAVAHQQGADPRARVHRPPREHGRRHAVDGVHPVRRLRVGLPLDGGRPASSSARPRSPRPTASSATRATRSSSSASRTSPRTRPASTTAPTASSASRRARRASRR